MESCVLIPPEFGLVMLAEPGCLMEMTATLWTRRVILPGTEFFPDRGEIRLDRLEVFSRIDNSDIRTKYGCTEDILSVEGTEVRHCNWVRFLRTCSDPAEANMIASKIDSHTVYKAVKCIPPNTEVIAYLEPVISEESAEECEMVTERETQETKEASSIQLGLSPVRSILPYSPISRDDECFSSISDDVSDDTQTDRSRPPSVSSEEGIVVPMDLTLSDHQTIPMPVKVSPVMRRNRERTWLPCEVCGKKFDRPSLLKRHMRTHTGEKPHACDVCGKAFSTSSSLNTHRRIHSGEKPHQCQQCGKCFTASSNLYYHRMTHNKEKPHKCSLCSKSFPTPGDLKSHMYVHNGSWPFKCDICNRGFSKQTNLKNHLILHTGEKPFECHLCSKKFALQCNLKTHVKSHDGEAQEACAKCGKGFLASSKQLYNGHCKSCFSVSPGSDSLSDKSSNSSPGRLSDFSISSLTSSGKKDSYNQNRQSTPLRRSSAGTSSPSTPNLSHPVALSGAHGHATGSPYFSGSLAVSPFPMMPNSPTLDRQFYIQGLYNKMMDDKAFSSQSSVIRDGYLNRPQMAMMAAHY